MNVTSRYCVLSLYLIFLTAFQTKAQNIILPVGATVQTFDVLGTSSTAGLPAGWKASVAGGGVAATWASSTVTSVSQAAHGGSPVAGGLYNWGTAPGTDRALGFMTDGGYASPNAIVAQYINKTGGVITNLAISYTVKRYRVNTNDVILNFFSSTDGTSFSPQVTGDVAAGAFANGASSYTFGTPPSLIKTVSISGLNIPAGGSVYFKWVITTGAASQGIGIDNFSIASTGVATLGATMTSTINPDAAPIGQPNPLDVIQYSTTVSNTGAGTATNVTVGTTQPQAGKTTLSGVVRTSALALDDIFSASYNTVLSTGNVLSNDYGLPTISVLSFGPSANVTATAAGYAGTTDNGGTVTVNANGSFSYTPPTNFSGTDAFKYRAGTGTLPNDDATVYINVAGDIVLSSSKVDLLCNGGGTGSITLFASGGAGGFLYSINNGGSYQASNQFSGLSAGTYQLLVKDGANYTKAGSVTISEPTAISFTTTPVNNTCSGASAGSITVNASGGTGALQYSKNNGTSYQVSNAFTNLTGGTYTIVVKDASGCTSTATLVTLTDPAAVGLTPVVNNIVCNGGTGTITLNATGGTAPLSYSINNGGSYQGSNQFSAVGAGTYTVSVKDANGCTSTSTVTLTNPAAVVVSGSVTTLTYNTLMSTVTFTNTGGVNPMVWTSTTLPNGLSLNSSTGALTGTPLVTGTFSVTVVATDVNGCTGSRDITIAIAPKVVADSYSVTGNTQLVAGSHSSPSTPFTTSGVLLLANDEPVGVAVVAATNSATVQGGSISINSAGAFTYTPPVGFTGTDTYVYTDISNGVTGTGTITFTITNMVWYVKAGGAAGDGRSNTPYNALTTTIGSPGQFIYVMKEASGSTGGNVTLQASQQLIGAGATLNVGSGTFVITGVAGNTPTLTGTVTLANSVTATGFDMNTGLNTALVSNGATAVNVNIGSVSSSGAVNAATFTSTTGSVTIAGGSLVNTSQSTFNISGGSVNLTYSGGITQGANAAMVTVSGGHSGTVTFQTGTLSTTNGTGLQFNNADGSYNFNGTTTLNGGDAGIDVTNGSGGTFTFNANTSIAITTDPTNEAITVQNSTATFTYSGSFNKSNGTRGILITGNTGGTIAINGTGTKVITSTGANNAIDVTSNTGATINFSGNNLLISSATGAGLNVTGGGTINVSGTGNTISSVGGTALNVVSTTIGASGLTFKSISANGGTNGIVLNNTGSTAGLTVSGNAIATVGGDNSGGLIQNSTGVGIYLNTTISPSFTNMKIFNTTNSGIKGTGVINFSFVNGTIEQSGDAPGIFGENESNISFYDQTNPTSGVNITGVVTITGNILNTAYYHGVDIYARGAGTISNLTISNNVFTTPTSSTNSLGHGIHVDLQGSGCNVTKATINNNQIYNVPTGAGIIWAGGNPSASGSTSNNGTPGSATDVITVTNNKIWGQSSSIQIGSEGIVTNMNGRGQGNFNVSSNDVKYTKGRGIGVSAFGQIIMTSTVSNNSIVCNNIFGSAGMEIGADSTSGLLSNGMYTATVTGNNISQTDGVGMYVIVRGSTMTLKAQVLNNTVSAPITTTSARAGIRIDCGSSAGNGTLCVQVENNTTGGSTNSGTGTVSPGINIRKQGTNASINIFGIHGLGLLTATEAQAEAYVSGKNTSTSGTFGTGGCASLSGDPFTTCTF